RPIVASLVALAACLPLAWGPYEPGLTLWPRAREWPKEREVARGLRIDALWEAIRHAPPGRVLFLRSAAPLDWRPEWWRPHTHLTALTPLRTGRAIVGGTFTHPAPVAGLVYTGSAAHRPLTRLAEQRDGRTLFGRPLEALDAETFNELARQLGIGLVVALEEDVGRCEFLTGNPSVERLSRIGPFSLFAMADGGTELVATGAQRWQVSVPVPSAGWVSLPIAYSPLWVARAGGRPLAMRVGERGLLDVALAAPTSAVQLEHRPGAAEWAGGVWSLVAAGALGLWWLRTRRA
ncbi:MAG: hypothetical protein ACREKG_08375, partial [Candidatus Rokuibacteriota bacterium]